ncbi:hypothetical protein [Nocardioides sp. Arc9.136]|nr:hypothetical protein [Nocardioides sp. Arc9.136]WKN48707.1 hypothetical protein OSR43_00875 [Nocardioides sp. Arc9.136]
MAGVAGHRPITPEKGDDMNTRTIAIIALIIAAVVLALLVL